jgi:hypothetical protein
VPVVIAALLVIPVTVIEQTNPGHGWRAAAAALNWAIWLVFLVELVVLLYVTDGRGRWLRRHPLEVAIVVLTPEAAETLISVPNRDFRPLQASIAKGDPDGPPRLGDVGPVCGFGRRATIEQAIVDSHLLLLPSLLQPATAFRAARVARRLDAPRRPARGFGERHSAFDRLPQRHRRLGFPLAVLQKHADDQGGYLAASD